LAKTLPASDEVVSAAEGEYSARAALHFQADPVKSAALFKDAGVVSVSLRGSMVFQTRSADAAARLIDELTTRASTAGATEIQGVTGLPDAKCIDAGMDTHTGHHRGSIAMRSPVGTPTRPSRSNKMTRAKKQRRSTSSFGNTAADRHRQAANGAADGPHHRDPV
jgi:hypothetical protein